MRDVRRPARFERRTPRQVRHLRGRAAIRTEERSALDDARCNEGDGRRNTFEELEPNLISIRTEPEFAIGQHAIVVRTPNGNVLWDCISFIDDETIERLDDLGGLSAIAISHPHFYSSCVEWAHATGAAIHLPAADAAYVMRPDASIAFFGEDSVDLVSGVMVVRIGGHFHGSTVLLWPAGASGRGVLLTGDTVALVGDPTSVTVMYSYPNRIPLSAAAARDIERRVAVLAFDRIYDGWRGDVIDTGAQEAVRRSLGRYAAMVEGTWPRR